jgi:hypothetical protein
MPRSGMGTPMKIQPTLPNWKLNQEPAQMGSMKKEALENLKTIPKMTFQMKSETLLVLWSLNSKGGQGQVPWKQLSPHQFQFGGVAVQEIQMQQDGTLAFAETINRLDPSEMLNPKFSSR